MISQVLGSPASVRRIADVPIEIEKLTHHPHHPVSVEAATIASRQSKMSKPHIVNSKI